MDAYDEKYAPNAFPLMNTGVICYLNSFLQSLAGCTAFTKAVLHNESYVKQTATGSAIYHYVTNYMRPNPSMDCSAIVLRALMQDLAVRRPHVRFGGGQESASEALMHILDMIDPEETPIRRAETKETPKRRAETKETKETKETPKNIVQATRSPIRRLFENKYTSQLMCWECKQVVSEITEYAVNFNLFHINKKLSPEAFSKALKVHVSVTEDYRCPKCPCECGATTIDEKCPNCGKKSNKVKAYRVYKLELMPEIVFCCFNIYNEHKIHYFPNHLEFDAVGGGKLEYMLVSQIEHSGSLSGGHYWARSMRKNGEVFLLNDSSIYRSTFAPSNETYIVVYNMKLQSRDIPN